MPKYIDLSLAFDSKFRFKIEFIRDRNYEKDGRQSTSYKISAHAADVARKRPGARDRDDELSKARFLFDWNKQFELSLDPEYAKALHDETLGDAYFKEAEFCSMCGPKFCSMHLSQELTRLGKENQAMRDQKKEERQEKLLR